MQETENHVNITPEADLLEPRSYSHKIEGNSSRGFQVGRFIIVFFFVMSILLVGAVGGVGGFVLLSNSKLSVMDTVRERLGLGDENSAVSIPVTQSIKVLESSSIIDASNKVSPAVVSITGTQTVRDFFGNTLDREVGGGTGMILTSDGLIATNKHVVSGLSGSKMSVILNDGRVFDASVKAVDTANDFAVIKIDAKDLPTVELGKSDDLVVGQYVIAVGNALGEYKNSVTLGVVSAKDRRIETGGGYSSSGEVLTGLIQTDAAINSGNSGGPLVNLAGQVVGINTAIASVSGGSIGIGFAIPIDSLKTVIASVIKSGEIVRPYLGVRYVGINKTIQQMNGLTVGYGAMVTRGGTQAEVAVMPGSPADKAGIVEGDIILELNGERVDEDNPLPKKLQKYGVGDEVSVKLLRKGEERVIKVRLDKMPS